MLIEIIPVIPWSKPSKTQKTIDICPKNAVSDKGCPLTTEYLYKVLVTGVPVSIHRYFDLTRAKLILARVELEAMKVSDYEYMFPIRKYKPISNELRFVGNDAVKLGFW